MNVESEEIVKVLQAVLSYLNITLPGQSLSPDAEMGRESLADKVQNLADKLSGSPSRSEEVANNDSVVEQEIYDDVQEMGSSTDADSDAFNRQSCYMEMNQSETSDASVPVATNPTFEASQDGNYEVNEVENQTQESLIKEEDENYEVPDPENKKSEVVELLEEDDEYDDVQKIVSNGDADFELTEDALLQKLKQLETTGSRNILNGSIYSGWLLKQKKKFISKWHKRYCILREQFLFYYQSEGDSRAIGVIVLPGYCISEEKSSSKDKFIFKLVPSGKGRSTYLFQVTSKTEFTSWLSALENICSQKLHRLSSDVFNRVAKRMDEESEDGSGGEPIKPKNATIAEEGEILEEEYDDCCTAQIYDDHMDQQQGEDIYEVVGMTQQPSQIPPRTVQNIAPPHLPSPSLPPRFQRPPVVPDEALYDDSIDHRDEMVQQSPTVPAEDMYEGIPGENYEPESDQNPPAQEELYEDIAPFQENTAFKIPPRPPTSLPPPLNLAPSLPARSPAIPERRTSGNDDTQPPPLPPSIPHRGERQIEPKTELIEEEPKVPSEDDFSYENVYIGTKPYAAKEADELAFNRGDLIYILQKVNANWWIGCMDKKVGLVPSNLLIAGFAH